MNLNENHEKIIKIIGRRGPSLPIQIARELQMNSLFISAFLSELVDNKRIKISHLKVGGSPLYFLEGQEEQLEPYHKYLHPKESDAFLMLKKEGVLKDSEQEPSIRVALRSIRDFSVSFKKNEEIFWKYFLISNDDAKNLLESEKEIKKKIKPELEIEEGDDSLEIGENVRVKIKPPAKIKPLVKIKNLYEKKALDETKNNRFKNPLVVESKKIKKEKSKSEFVLKVIDFIQKQGFEIIQEKDYKSKEYNCISRINSDLGKIDFLTQAKDKKNINESDLRKLLSTSQSIPMPAFIIYNKEISKKGIEFAKNYSSVLKIKKIT